MRWFKHMADMRHDLFIKELRAKHGLEGKAIWDLVLEIYAEACGNEPGQPVLIDTDVFRREIGISGKKMEKFLNFFQENSKLSWEIFGKKIKINIPKMQELRDEWSRKLRSHSGVTPDTEDRRQKTEERKIAVDPPTPLPGGTATAEGVFFEIKRPDGTYSEKEWIRTQFIEHLRQSKKPFDRAASLETILGFNNNLVGLFRRWLKIPIQRRMAVLALVILDKTALGNQFTYALKVAENGNPTPEQAKELSGYLKVAESLVAKGIYEVEVDV